MNKEKKYRRSKIAIVCYVLAFLMLAYTCYTMGNTVATINQYYAQYDMSATPQEYITYILQGGLEPLFQTIVIFMLGFILDAVRKNNPANYKSDDDIADEKMAKTEAKDAKQYAKAEAAAAAKKGKELTARESVKADFAKSLEEELKADDAAAQKPKSQRKPRNNQRKSSGENKSRESADSNGERKNNQRSGAKKKQEGDGAEKSGKKSSGNKGGNRRGRKPAEDKAKTDIKPAAEEAKADVKAVAEEAKTDVKAAVEETKADFKAAAEEVKSEVRSAAETEVTAADGFSVTIAGEDNNN